ncbi:phosphotransferase enzyme family protein [Asaia astilbis]|uniref:phosphotransferase enzyme family protein n=1 Tax=Asaia astilbis TaxID=610244 RepID=UPI000470B784|nr:phosphotransferase [Asaia astilbis]
MTEGIPPSSPGQFGLWGQESKRDWPLITPDEASRVLTAFGLNGVETIDWHSARPFSAVSRLSDEAGKSWFLKRHHRALRDPVALGEEHALITHLHHSGLGVACPRAAKDGTFTVAIGAWSYECFPAIRGADLYRDRMSWEPYLSLHHAHEAGAALARFHEASKGWDASPRSDRPLVSALTPLLDDKGPAEGLKSWAARNRDLHAALENEGSLETIFAPLQPHLDHAAPFLKRALLLWGHGDWHGSNLSWCGVEGKETVSAPFDFGMSDLTTRGFDIAVALERSMFGWMGPQQTTESALPDFTVHLDQIDAFLAGYEQIHSLSAHDHAEIAAYLPLAHVTFACSEIWYYAHLLHAAELAKTTCTTYLQGHARWFSADHGRSILNHIATRCGKTV